MNKLLAIILCCAATIAYAAPELPKPLPDARLCDVYRRMAHFYVVEAGIDLGKCNAAVLRNTQQFMFSRLSAKEQAAYKSAQANVCETVSIALQKDIPDVAARTYRGCFGKEGGEYYEDLSTSAYLWLKASGQDMSKVW
jgi:hypothetical protein